MQTVSEGLLSEIIRSLEFYSATSSQRPIQRAVLCGGGSRVPGLDRMLEELAEFPVQIADPFSRIEIPKGFKDQEKVAELAPALSVAVGLAIRGVNES